MAVSLNESTQIICPNCGRRVDAQVWTIVDAAERPDLGETLRNEQLNCVRCPTCDARWVASTALLYHDPTLRRVYFAVPANTPEHRWRERAQELLYALVGALPDEQRLPYLGDVQLEQEIAGVRRAVLRRERVRRGTAPAQPSFGKPVESVLGALTPAPLAREAQREEAPQVTPANHPADTALADAIGALLAADDADEFQSVLTANPALLTDEGDALVHQLANTAYNQGEHTVSNALRELRATLARLRTGGTLLPPAAEPLANEVLEQAPTDLSTRAYQAVLQSDSPGTMAEATRDYPQLLEPWADDALAARSDAALEEGNERLAQAIEERREALAELREQVGNPTALLASVDMLLTTRSDDARAELLASNPVLLTDSAQAALANLAASAQAQGNAQLAANALASRTLLRTVRAGLEASS